MNPHSRTSVGLVMDVSDMDAFMATLASDAGQAAAAHDGVRVETIRFFVEE